jgi:hypothetical protein
MRRESAGPFLLHLARHERENMSPTEPPPPPSLTVGVINGNLAFVREPLLLGHYRSMAPAGAEKVMDRFLAGALQESMALGGYPDVPGAAQVFINRCRNEDKPLQDPRPEAVIVVGLGDEGSLDSTELATTVSHGVIAWAQRRAEQPAGEAAPFALATTLMGSGGTGMTAGHSARLVVQGVLDANERLARSKRPGVTRLNFIELYLDRATEAWRALREQAAATPGAWKLEDVIETGQGGLLRPLDASYRGASYDLIAAKTVRGDGDSQGIEFILDTRRARTEVHANVAQGPLLRELVATAADSRQNDPSTRRTLFRLLVPLELEPFLSGSSETVIELDAGTAGIPWEILDPSPNGDGAEGPLPWAIRAKLLRKLEMADFRPRVTHAIGPPLALVIGEPAVDPKRYPRLPSAHAEAKVVSGVLDDLLPGQVQGLFSPGVEQVGPNALRVVNALHERDWRVVHITGHGEPPVTSGGLASSGGVVLSNGSFLGPAEIRSLRVIPELVFINCCHLARRDPDQLLEDEAGGLRHPDRPRLAASLADALTREGVRCVVAAGWAVDDEPAQEFAVTFYRSLVAGRRFMDAVADAREAAFAKGGNTWAAYQCYGDPEWTLTRDSETATEPLPPDKAFVNVSSPVALTLALETLAANSPRGEPDGKRYRKSLEYLRGRFEGRWGDLGSVAEAFARAWAQCDEAQAITWYERAAAANDGTASLRAVEQLGNLRVRQAWGVAERARGQPSGQREAIDEARKQMMAALDLLRSVRAVAPSIERESLCGSAWKRVAMLEALAEDRAAEQRAIAEMRDNYLRAEEMAWKSNAPNLSYPALNGMAAELIVDAVTEGWKGFDPERLRRVRACLDAQAKSDPEFWILADQIGLRVYEVMAVCRLDPEYAAIEAAYRGLYVRDASPGNWESVRDQLRFLLSARRSWPEDDRRAGLKLVGLLDGFAGGST